VDSLSFFIDALIRILCGSQSGTWGWGQWCGDGDNTMGMGWGWGKWDGNGENNLGYGVVTKLFTVSCSNTDRGINK